MSTDNKKDERKELKLRISQLFSTLLTSSEDEEKEVIQKEIFHLRNQLHKQRLEINKTRKEARRKVLEGNQVITDILLSFWAAFLPYTQDGFLSKDGYARFSEAMQIALLHAHHYESLDAMVNADWPLERTLFGALDKAAFVDLLLETLEIWAQSHSAGYYAAFLWTLLNAIADTRRQPPKLLAPREIQYIGDIPEAKLVEKYMAGRAIRAKLSNEADRAARSVEAHKRQRARKQGALLNTGDVHMVEALSKSSLSTSSAVQPAPTSSVEADSDEEEREDARRDRLVVSVSQLLASEIDPEEGEEGEVENEVEKEVVGEVVLGEEGFSLSGGEEEEEGEEEGDEAAQLRAHATRRAPAELFAHALAQRPRLATSSHTSSHTFSSSSQPVASPGPSAFELYLLARQQPPSPLPPATSSATSSPLPAAALPRQSLRAAGGGGGGGEAKAEMRLRGRSVCVAAAAEPGRPPPGTGPRRSEEYTDSLLSEEDPAPALPLSVSLSLALSQPLDPIASSAASVATAATSATAATGSASVRHAAKKGATSGFLVIENANPAYSALSAKQSAPPVKPAPGPQPVDALQFMDNALVSINLRDFPHLLASPHKTRAQRLQEDADSRLDSQGTHHAILRPFGLGEDEAQDAASRMYATHLHDPLNVINVTAWQRTAQYRARVAAAEAAAAAAAQAQGEQAEAAEALLTPEKEGAAAAKRATPLTDRSSRLLGLLPAPQPRSPHPQESKGAPKASSLDALIKEQLRRQQRLLHATAGHHPKPKRSQSLARLNAAAPPVLTLDVRPLSRGTGGGTGGPNSGPKPAPAAPSPSYRLAPLDPATSASRGVKEILALGSTSLTASQSQSQTLSAVSRYDPQALCLHSHDSFQPDDDPLGLLSASRPPALLLPAPGSDASSVASFPSIQHSVQHSVQQHSSKAAGSGRSSPPRVKSLLAQGAAWSSRWSVLTDSLFSDGEEDGPGDRPGDGPGPGTGTGPGEGLGLEEGDESSVLSSSSSLQPHVLLTDLPSPSPLPSPAPSPTSRHSAAAHATRKAPPPQHAAAMTVEIARYRPPATSAASATSSTTTSVANPTTNLNTGNNPTTNTGSHTVSFRETHKSPPRPVAQSAADHDFVASLCLYLHPHALTATAPANAALATGAACAQPAQRAMTPGQLAHLRAPTPAPILYPAAPSAAPPPLTIRGSLPTSSCTSSGTSSPPKVVPPWLPGQAAAPRDHDRSETVRGWAEKLQLLTAPNNITPAKHTAAVLAQHTGKQAFEAFAAAQRARQQAEQTQLYDAAVQQAQRASQQVKTLSRAFLPPALRTPHQPRNTNHHNNNNHNTGLNLKKTRSQPALQQ